MTLLKENRLKRTKVFYLQLLVFPVPLLQSVLHILWEER